MRPFPLRSILLLLFLAALAFVLRALPPLPILFAAPIKRVEKLFQPPPSDLLLPAPPGTRFLARAEIAGYHPLDESQLLFIDKGKKDGIAEGAIALAPQGTLIGRVIEVYASYSAVLLITHPRESIDVRIGDRGYRALVSGQFVGLSANRGLWLTQGEYLDREAAVSPGDSVETSGLDGAFPKGILIGQVVSVSSEADGLFSRASIRPGADFTALDALYLFSLKKQEAP